MEHFLEDRFRLRSHILVRLQTPSWYTRTIIIHENLSDTRSITAISFLLNRRTTRCTESFHVLIPHNLVFANPFAEYWYIYVFGILSSEAGRKKTLLNRNKKKRERGNAKSFVVLESPFSNQFRRLSRKIRDCGFRLLSEEWNGSRRKWESVTGREWSEKVPRKVRGTKYLALVPRSKSKIICHHLPKLILTQYEYCSKYQRYKDHVQHTKFPRIIPFPFLVVCRGWSVHSRTVSEQTPLGPPKYSKQDTSSH